MRLLRLFVALIMLLFPAFACAGTLSSGGEDGSELSKPLIEMSLEELLEVRVTVTTETEREIRDAPGIVSVITRDRILRSGARDLIDLLRLVPGLHLAVDVQNVVGIGVRGNWANEGKVLLLIDGIEMNELLYSTLQFGNHYPLEAIERIEIIRGPGSVLYGGNAELAVIRVTTLSGAERDGAALRLTYGRMEHSLARANLEVGYGRSLLDGDLDLSISGLLGEGTRSDREYRDIYGDRVDLIGNSDLNPGHLNVGISYRGATLRFLYDNYRTTLIDGFDELLDRAYANDYLTCAAALTYELELGDLELTPRVSYRYCRPWHNTDEDAVAPYLYYDVGAARYKGSLRASYEFTEELSLLAGTEAYLDYAWVRDFERAQELGAPVFADNQSDVTYGDVAGFSRLLFDNAIANLTLGARAEYHSEYGFSFVPRFAATRVFDGLHLKFLASRAFRAPGIENIATSSALGIDIEPEMTLVLEVETGYRLSRHIELVVNAFDITIDNTIVYFYDEENDVEGYRNFNKSGTRGVEAKFRAYYESSGLDVGYSFYHPNGKNDVEDYEVPGNDHALMGFPAHKLTVNAGYEFDDLFLSGWVALLGSRFAYTSVDDEEESEFEELEPQTLIGLNVSYRGLLKGLDLSLSGFFNLPEQRYVHVQPYNGYHAPLPGTSAEIMLRLSYNYGFLMD